MKTAVSIPDPVFRRAERLAARIGTTRSNLYSQALTEYILHHDDDEVTAAMNRVCDALDEPTDPFVSAAARRILDRVEW